MDLNNNESILSKLCEIPEDDYNDIDISLNLVKKQKESDNYYQSLDITLAPDVKDWLKKQIIKSIKSLKLEGEGNNKKFYVGNYNHEIKKQDQIAKYDLTNSTELKGKKDKLISAVRNPDSLYQENNTNFQMVRISYQTKEVYFCFYRGTKKNSTRKKSLLQKNSNQFEFLDQTIVDVGGNFDFFLIEDYLFILNITNFEYAFDYRDHINKLRDENINSIISMPFFDQEDSNKTEFEKSCKTFIYSRSLAQIDADTITALQQKFVARCNELSHIKNNAPIDEHNRTIYIEKYGSIWTLLEYIDIDNYKIKFNAGDNPTPLIHFFADKIAKSFLTEAIKVVSSYE